MPAHFVLVHSYNGGVSKKPDLDVVQIQRFVCAAFGIVPPKGTAYLARSAVNGYGREPVPPARIMLIVFPSIRPFRSDLSQTTQPPMPSVAM
jgi:hypothetical protein